MTAQNRMPVFVAMMLIGLGTVVGALGASASNARDATSAAVDQSKDLAAKTEECVSQGGKPGAPICQEARAKAAEVQASPAPVTVNVIAKTDAEIRQLVVDTVRARPDLLPRGADGKDAVLTEQDYQRIADIVQGRVPEPRDGKDAVVDYDLVIAAVLAKIPVPSDGPSGPKGEPGVPGATGPDGKPGPTPVSSRFERMPNTQCVYTVTYSDGTATSALSPELNCLPV